MENEEVVAATTPSKKRLFVPSFHLPKLCGIYEPMEGVVDIDSGLEDLIPYGFCVIAIIDHKHIKFQDPLKERLADMVEIADCLLEDSAQP